MAPAAEKDEQYREQILSCLGHLVDSGALGEKSRLRQLLRYLVVEEIEGRGERLKAYTIATDVFSRGPDFDPSTDSIVRVEVNRLRQALDHFYRTQGESEQVRITIPKGTYRPRFSAQVPVPPSGQSPPIVESDLDKVKSRQKIGLTILAGVVVLLVVFAVVRGLSLLDDQEELAGIPGSANPNSITVLVREHDDGSENADEQAISTSIIRQLRAALSRNEALSVVRPDGASDPENRRIDFVIDGFVQSTPESDRLSVEVVNGHTKALVWGRTYDLRNDQSKDHEAIVTQISRELRTRLLGASKEVLEGRDPSTLSALQLFVMATWVPGPAVNAIDWEKERVAFARLAVQKDPNFGPAYSVLADKLSYLANMDASSNTDAALQEAKENWQKAMELSPLDANVVFNVAQGQWHSGHIDEAIRSMKRVVELDPNHALAGSLATVIPYTCAAAPDDVVATAISFDESLAADNPIRWLTLTWIAWLHLHREEYDLALEAERRAAQIFQIPYTFMRHAVLLNIKGKPEEAAALIASHKANWPDIDPNHFATVTVPRLCRESESGDRFIQNYVDLAAAMKRLR